MRARAKREDLYCTVWAKESELEGSTRPTSTDRRGKNDGKGLSPWPPMLAGKAALMLWVIAAVENPPLLRQRTHDGLRPEVHHARDRVQHEGNKGSRSVFHSS